MPGSGRTAARSRIAATVTPALVVLGSVVASAASPTVEYTDGRLSVIAVEQPAKEIFTVIQDKTGAEIRAPERILERRVTVRVRALELERGIAQILRSLRVENHYVVHGEGGMVFVVMENGPPGTSAAVAAPNASRDTMIRSEGPGGNPRARGGQRQRARE